MSAGNKNLLRTWIKNPISRRSLLGIAALTTLASTSIGRALGVTAPVITQVLGRPTDTTIALNVLSSDPVTAIVEFGYTKTKYSVKSKELSLIHI